MAAEDLRKKVERPLPERELHDLCQPLTTLQCKLEYGQMMGDESSLREAVDGGLEECARMFACIAAMRARLLQQVEQGLDERE